MPRKKRSKGPLFAILGVCLLAAAGLWTFGVIKKNADDTYTQPTITEPSYRATSPAPSPTGTEPTQTASTEPTQAPTTTTAPTPPEASALDIVAKNSLYRTGPQRTVNCKEPNIRPNTNANAARYWVALKPCLDRAWARQIALARQEFRAPGMLYWSGTNVTSPCSGGVPTVPFYCSTNHMMYMKVDNFSKSYNQYSDAESKAYARMWYTRSIAHEYGHAVQSITGILEAAHKLRYEAANYDDRTLMTRRTELQANCLAGVFLASNKRSYPIDGLLLRVWNKWVVTAGDPPGKGTHGSAASQARFMGKSFVTGNPATCNTFTASRGNVN
ncbi:neutral zinc metallopeptidase [Kribbella sancticallisti]